MAEARPISTMTNLKWLWTGEEDVGEHARTVLIMKKRLTKDFHCFRSYETLFEVY
jgi:hypothetical protein